MMIELIGLYPNGRRDSTRCTFRKDLSIPKCSSQSISIDWSDDMFDSKSQITDLEKCLKKT